MSKDQSPQYASVGIRIVAGLWDWLVALLWGILGGIVLTAVYYFGWFFLNPDTYVDSSSRAIGLGITIFLIFPSLTLLVMTWVHFCYGICLYLRNHRPGHRFGWLLIVTTDGEQVPKGKALLRYIIGSPLFLFPHWYVLVFILYRYIPNLLGIDHFADFLLFGISAGLILVVIPLLILVNHIWMIIDRKNRGLNDVIAGTVVLDDRLVVSESGRLTSRA